MYITNIVKRRPPQNRDPFAEEIEAYAVSSKTDRHHQTGDDRDAWQIFYELFLPDAKISRDHGTATRINASVLVPLYHPAAALRSGKMFGSLKRTFLELPKLLKRRKNRLNKRKIMVLTT